LEKPDMTANLDLDEQTERIRLAREESDKYHAETRKLMAESEKLHAEEIKLFVESLKLRGDRWISPIVAIGTTIAAVASVLNLLRHP
jgi:hypothetical protein